MTGADRSRVSPGGRVARLEPPAGAGGWCATPVADSGRATPLIASVVSDGDCPLPVLRTRHGGRRGYTLIEMLLVMTGIAVLFGTSVGMIHMLLRLDRGNRGRLGEKATISRLAHQFRRDAHAAEAARRIDVPQRHGLELAFPGGGTIEYIEEGGRLLRIETANGETLAQEAYRLPSRGRPKVELHDADGRRWGILVLEPNPNGKEIVPSRPVIVEAWVGKDERLRRAGEDER